MYKFTLLLPKVTKPPLVAVPDSNPELPIRLVPKIVSATSMFSESSIACNPCPDIDNVCVPIGAS